MLFWRIVGQIEQNQRIPTRAEALRLHRCADCRKRMEHANRRLLAEMLLNCCEDSFEIADELRPVMMLEGTQRVLPMIAKIEEHQLITIKQKTPEREVAVNRKAIAMTEGQPRSLRIAVLTNPYKRAIIADNFDNPAGSGKCNSQGILFDRNADRKGSVDQAQNHLAKFYASP